MRNCALGIVAAGTLLAASVPAMAQVGFYVGPGGAGVVVGAPYYGYPYGYYNYYGYYGGRGIAYTPGRYWSSGW